MLGKALESGLISRLIIDRGHGYQNLRKGQFDSGATSGWESEASLVSFVAGGAFALLPPSSVVITPELPLLELVRWINTIAREGDILVALHMNAADSPAATGVECVFPHNAPAYRRNQALTLANLFATNVGLVSRGALEDTATPQGKPKEDGRQGLPLMRDTRMPAFILEMGFVTNVRDTEYVLAHGAKALVTSWNALRVESLKGEWK